jgi:hypothetical protein
MSSKKRRATSGGNSNCARLIIDRRARLAQGLGLFQGLFAVDLLRPEAAARDVIPIEVLRRRAIREPDFERAALRHDLVLDQLVSVNVGLKTVGSAEAVEDDRSRSRRPGGPDHKMLQFEAAPDGAPVSQFPHCVSSRRIRAIRSSWSAHFPRF